MNEPARYDASDGDHGNGMGDAAPWHPARDALWFWVEIVLQEARIAQVDVAEGRGLCALALEVYAPALTIALEDAGIAGSILLFARIAELYSDRYGSPSGYYTVDRLQAVVRSLRRRPAARLPRRGEHVV